jgi:Ran GTPase-activating protein (RanGAP) involved in mRNA processing and transport
MHTNEIAKAIKLSSHHIRVLNLSKNRITDDGFVPIVKALCESGIEQMNLSGNKISEKCIDTIVGSLKTNKTLKVLDL